LFCGCQNKPQAGAPADPPSGAGQVSADSPAAGKVELQILDFDGIQQLIASHRGRVVVMDVWSTSCAPCVKEFPKLVALHAKYGPDRLACISLSLDYEGIGTPQEQAAPVQKFLDTRQATFENVLGKEESDVLRSQLKITGPPVVFVYDKSGQLRKRFDNDKAEREADAFTYEQIGALVAELLAEEIANEPEGAAPGK
jgi:thiol-disulfide isomerase/thioredoxin